MSVDVTGTEAATHRPRERWVGRIESARVAATPVVALLVSGLVVCSVVTLPDVALRWDSISGLGSRTSGWVAFAVALGLASAVLGLLAGRWLGPGPAVLVGALLAPIGLALSQDVGGEAQLVVALSTLAVGVGGLFAGGLCLFDGLAPRAGSATFVGLLLPLAGGWGAVEWLALRDPGAGQVRLGLHPPALALGVVTVVLLLWAMTTLASGPPPRFDFRVAGWENAWAALGFVAAGVLCIAMLIGFQDDVAASWGRPVVLLTAGVATAGLLGCAAAVPVAAARVAQLGVVVALISGPSCVGALLLVPSLARGALSGWILVALAMAGALGVVLGVRRPSGTALGWLVGGLLLLAASAAGGWVMPANEWVMLAAAAPMCTGLAAAVSAGFSLALVDRLALRCVGVAGLAALLLGLLGAPAVAWGLGAGFGPGHTDARAGGRVLLGLTFALAVLGAAGCAVLLDRARSTALRPGEPTDPGPVTANSRPNAPTSSS